MIFGGNWTTQDKKVGGAYINFVGKKKPVPAPIKWDVCEISSDIISSKADMVYGNGRFAICGKNSDDDYVVVITTDFINFKQTVVSHSPNRIRFLNGKFFIIGGNAISYSKDGENWTNAMIPVSANWTDIAYGDGYYVAISGDTTATKNNISVYSTDLNTWTQVSLPVTAVWQAVCYGNGSFKAITLHGDHIAGFYPSRLAWTDLGAFGDGFFYNIYFNDTKFYLPISKAFDSIDQIRIGDAWEWEDKTLPVAATWRYMAFGEGYTIVVPHSLDGINLINSACYTKDGETWKKITLPLTTKRLAATYGNGMFVCLHSKGVEVCRMTDNY